MPQEIKLIKGPDGYYFGKILKTGLPSADAHKVTDQEIFAMMEDALRRNRAETGRSVMTVFDEAKDPIFIAKYKPSILECGVVPMPRQPMRVPFAQVVPKGRMPMVRVPEKKKTQN